MNQSPSILSRAALALLATMLGTLSSATTLVVTDPAGGPLATAMVRERPAGGPNLDTSDNGYQAPGLARTVVPEVARFTDAAGQNEIQSPMAEVILGGLLSSTFLNLVVVPALFARWGERAGTASDYAVVNANTMP